MADFDLALRLGLATLIGAVIGLNRDLHGKPAGVRTHAIVALASALVVLVAGSLPGADGFHAADAQSRVMQGLVTGIGFLGAGVILHSDTEKKVHGLTTAAGIWAAALIGSGCGAGEFKLVLIAAALLAVVLTVGGAFERALRRWLEKREGP